MQRLLSALRRSPVRSGGFFVAACILTFILEHAAESLTADGAHHPGLTQSVFNARGVYQNLVASWPRRLVPRYTVLVQISPGDPTAVSLHRLCEQREFLGRLLLAVADRDPAIIVVDKYFTTSRCPADNQGTLDLQKAIATVSARIPTIVGLRVDEAARLPSCPSPKPRSTRLGASETCPLVQGSEAHRRWCGRAGILRPSALHGQAGFALHEGEWAGGADQWRAFGGSEKRRWWTTLPGARSDGADRRLRESAGSCPPRGAGWV
jgi:hypothetical protein